MFRKLIFTPSPYLPIFRPPHIITPPLILPTLKTTIVITPSPYLPIFRPPYIITPSRLILPMFRKPHIITPFIFNFFHIGYSILYKHCSKFSVHPLRQNFSVVPKKLLSEVKKIITTVFLFYISLIEYIVMCVDYYFFIEIRQKFNFVSTYTL